MREWVWIISEEYWSLLGGPLSRIQAWATESVSVSLVECVLWVLLPCAFLSLWPKYFKSLRLMRYLSWSLLFLMLTGQGALSPFYLAPSAWRKPVHETLRFIAVDTSDLRAQMDLASSHLQNFADNQAYFELNDQAAIQMANLSLDRIIDSLGFSPGREVAKIKDMQGISRRLGQIYGGPAYHDPLSTEIAIAPPSYPLPKYWRIMAIFHESAHAKGFSREIDAELLTWFALWRLPEPYHSLALAMFLAKTGADFPEHSLWQDEREKSRKLRKLYYQEHPIENFLRQSSESLGLINSPDKYGSLKQLKSVKSTHPFFGPVLAELKRHG